VVDAFVKSDLLFEKIAFHLIGPVEETDK